MSDTVVAAWVPLAEMMALPFRTLHDWTPSGAYASVTGWPFLDASRHRAPLGWGGRRNGWRCWLT